MPVAAFFIVLILKFQAFFSQNKFLTIFQTITLFTKTPSLHNVETCICQQIFVLSRNGLFLMSADLFWPPYDLTAFQ